MTLQLSKSNVKVIVTFIATLFLISVLLYLLFRILQPFFFIFLAAFVLAVLLNPVFEYFHTRRNYKEITSSGITIGLFLVTVSIPLFIIATLLAREVSDILDFVSANYGTRNELTASLYANLGQFGINTQNIEVEVDKYAVSALRYISTNLSGLLSQTVGLFFSAMMVVLVTFYFLVHKNTIASYLWAINPLRTPDTERLTVRAREVITATIRGNLTIIAIQSVIGILGFFLFGLPSPILLGVIYGLCSIIPMVGITMVAVPAILFLFVTSSLPASLGLAAWCFGTNILMDNLVGPKIVSGNTELHPVLILFGVLGGVQLFGIFGIIIGPTIVALSLVALDMFRDLLKAEIKV